MYEVKKDGRKARLFSEIQLSAFIKNGWKQVESTEKHKEAEAEEIEPHYASADVEDTTALKAEAEGFGLKPHWNAKAETIRQMIAEHKASME